MNTKKIVLIGDGQIGKTTFVNMLMGKFYSINYKATLLSSIHPIRRGNKCYNIWDCAGQEQFVGLRDGYYIQAQGAIVMCDPSNLESIKHVEKWSNDFKRVVGDDIPIVYVINKSELLPNDFNVEGFVKISCKNNENLEEVLSRF